MCCARRGYSRFDPGRSVRCSTHSAARPSPCAITRSPTSTWIAASDRLAERVMRIDLEFARRGASVRGPRGRRSVSIILEPVIWWRCRRRDSWFAYPYWLDDRLAPDFARTVDIHRKPGYDPCELFFDPRRFWPQGRAIWQLARKKLGFRTLFDVVPLDPSLRARQPRHACGRSRGQAGTDRRRPGSASKPPRSP